jgi:hypothetical protein
MRELVMKFCVPMMFIINIERRDLVFIKIMAWSLWELAGAIRALIIAENRFLHTFTLK